MERSIDGVRLLRKGAAKPLFILVSTFLMFVAFGTMVAGAARANGTLVVRTVDAQSSVPVQSILLSITSSSENEPEAAYQSDYTDSEGCSSFSLPAGSYRINAIDWRLPSRYARQYWNQKTYWTMADPATVADGQTTTYELRMVAGAHIRGRVVNAAGEPLAGMMVYICAADPYTLSEWYPEATTDSAGCYDIGGLQSGEYVVEVCDMSDYYLYQFYPDQLTVRAGSRFFVGAGETIAAPDVVMKLAAKVTGAITTRLGVIPRNVMCAAERLQDGKWVEIRADCCNNDCTYAINQLPPGRYRFCFYGRFTAVSRQYYQDNFKSTSWPSEAKVFDIGEGQQLSGINMIIWGDTEAPVTQAPEGEAVRRGGRAVLPYRVADGGRHGPTADVTIKVKTLTGKIVKVIRLPDRPVNQLRRCYYRCGLPRGRYRFCVFAIDSGGNRQRRIASNLLTVR